MKAQSKKIAFILCLFFAFMSIMLTGCGSDSESPDKASNTSSELAQGTKVFEDKDFGIKFSYPAAWNKKEKDGSTLVAFSSDSGNSKNFFVFSVIADKNNENTNDIEVYGKKAEEQLKSTVPNTKITSNKTMQIGDYKAVRLDYSGEKNGITIKSIAVFLLKDKNAYAFMFMANDVMYSKNIDYVENLIKSISIK